MVRPVKPLDWKKVDNLLMAGCHGTEIAANFDMHPETFYRKVQEEKKVGFTEYSALKRSQGDSLLRAKQFEKALEKDNTMMIWLGKNRLNQRENTENTNYSAEEVDRAKRILEQVSRNQEASSARNIASTKDNAADKS